MKTIFAVGALVLSVASVQAEAPAPFPEFTFKRIGPPNTGASRRITVQIAPTEGVVAPTPTVPSAGAPAPANPQVTAFWSEVSPALSAAGAGRLLAASEVTRKVGLQGPSLSALQGVATRYGRVLLGTSIETGVSPALALAVIAVESAGQAEAVSKAGAQGLMQLMPATAARFEVADPFEPAQNIEGGMRYLGWLLNKFDGDPLLALAGYNAGENAVTGAGGVPEYAETRAYVPKVVAAWDVARRMCLTPPDLASDGCVFATMASN